jgi:hypothetical protein
MDRFTHTHDPLLGPPAHVLAEVDAAWERSQDLSAGELELHFARADSDPAHPGRVTGELRLPDGELVERISATEALALACGDAALALAA